MGIPDHLTCLLRNLYTSQEATVRTGHGTTDWFQIGKGVHQGCILSPCLFNLYSEYIMQNARLDVAQSGIKIAWRNINDLRYANDTTLMRWCSPWGHKDSETTGWLNNNNTQTTGIRITTGFQGTRGHCREETRCWAWAAGGGPGPTCICKQVLNKHDQWLKTQFCFYLLLNFTLWEQTSHTPEWNDWHIHFMFIYVYFNIIDSPKVTL